MVQHRSQPRLERTRESVTIEQMPHNFEIRHRMDDTELDEDVRGQFSKLEELLEGSNEIDTGAGRRRRSSARTIRGGGRF